MCDMGHPSDCLCFIPVLQSGALCVIWATHQTVYVLFLFYRVVHYVWYGPPIRLFIFYFRYRLVHYLWYGPPIRLFMFYSCLQTGALCVVWATHQTVYVLFLFTEWCTMCDMGHPSDCLCFIPVLQSGALCVVRITHQAV